MKTSQFVVIFPFEFESKREIGRPSTYKVFFLLYVELLIYVAVGY